SRFGRTEYSEKLAADFFKLARERRCELRPLRRRRHRHRRARGRVVRIAPRAGAERVLYARDYFVNLCHVSLAGAYAGAGAGSCDTSSSCRTVPASDADNHRARMVSAPSRQIFQARGPCADSVPFLQTFALPAAPARSLAAT